jgi:hypothetical protein
MTAMLYELTASAAQMCAPVPTAAPGGFIDRLDHWQTLLGAAIGGGLGVAGAWVVAASQRSREQRIAAGMVLPDLHQLAAAGESLQGWLADHTAPVPLERHAAAVLKRLRERRPLLFALHTPVLGQLSDLDARLYSHLFQCEMTHRMLEDGIAAQQVTLDAVMAASRGDPWGYVSRGTAPSDNQLYQSCYAVSNMRPWQPISSTGSCFRAGLVGSSASE